MQTSSDEEQQPELRHSLKQHTSSPLEWKEVPFAMQGLPGSGSSGNSTNLVVLAACKPVKLPLNQIKAQVYVAAQDLGEPSTMTEALQSPEKEE